MVDLQLVDYAMERPGARFGRCVRSNPEHFADLCGHTRPGGRRYYVSHRRNVSEQWVQERAKWAIADTTRRLNPDG